MSNEDVVHEVARHWNAAALSWNPDKLAALYDQDAVFFGGRPGHSVGAQAINGYFTSYVGVLKSAQMEMVEQHVTELAPGTLLAQGYVQFKFVLASGEPTSSKLRSTWVLVKRGGAWVILEHHFSPTPDVPPIR